ncbi:MAG: CBS domain-containing protein [Desulfatiglans sp.]|jgi:CBS domain-containing protein|nr:CBS domain-containing protein [Thermodesulfobacteriota bacterium]MEE4351243.1 CBS domain-containing protein [Desulfatiglans sp.]
MARAKEIMTTKVITVFPDTTIAEAAKLMLENHFNGLPVVDEGGRLTGIICQNDLIFQQKKIPIPSFFTVLDSLIPLGSEKSIEKEVKKISAVTVESAMTHDPITVDPETDIEEIASLMIKHSIHSLPVLDQGKLVGIVGKEDILRTLLPGGKPG